MRRFVMLHLADAVMARPARVAASVAALVLLATVGAAETARVITERAEVRREASAGAAVLGTVEKGTVLQVLGREGGWLRVAYPIGNGAFYNGHIPAVFCEDARGAAPSAAPSAAQPAAPATPVGVPPATVPVSAPEATQQQPTVNTATSAAPPPPSAPTPATPAPTHIGRGAKVFIEPSEFGMALAAAILKKHVPVVALTDREKADFFVQTVSESKKQGTGERVANILAFGAFAGSGKSFDATVTIANRDGVIVFAHNSKKENFQSAAENIAKKLKDHVEEE